MGLFFFIITIVFCFVTILSSSGIITFPIEKLGISLFPKNFKYTKFIYRNLNKMVFMEEFAGSKYFLLRKQGMYYTIVFMESWLFHIYEGSSREEIKNAYDLGGQSNKAEYLTSREKSIGKKIEEWYLKNYVNS